MAQFGIYHPSLHMWASTDVDWHPESFRGACLRWDSFEDAARELVELVKLGCCRQGFEFVAELPDVCHVLRDWRNG